MMNAFKASLGLLLLASLAWPAAVKEDPAVPMRRVTEYPWMSVQSWNERAARLAQQSRKGGVDVLFFGDSITERWAGPGAAVWRARYEPLKAANYGIGGDTTQNALWRLMNGELDGLDPKAVVVMIGTNNLGLRGDAPDDAARGVEAVVAGLRGRFPHAKIALFGLLPRGEKASDPFRAQIAAVNARISRLDDGNAVRYLDIGPRLLQADGSIAKTMMADFLHPEAPGYAVWADALDPVLRDFLH
jgi:lysophospholipase L1-like esterase